MCNQFHHRTPFVAIMIVSGYWKSLSLVTVVKFLLTDFGKFHHLISTLDGLSWSRSFHCSVVFEVLVHSEENFTSSSAPNTEKISFSCAFFVKTDKFVNPQKMSGNCQKIKAFFKDKGLQNGFCHCFHFCSFC